VEGKINRVTFSLENYLDARLENGKDKVTYRQWATLNLSQGYDIGEARRHEEPWEKKKPFEPLTAVLTLKPLQHTDLYGVAKWDHYDHEITFADLSLELSVDRPGGRKVTFKVDYQYEKNSKESLKFWGDVNLTYGFSAGSSLERDMDLGQNISNSYWVVYQSQCWGVKLVAEKEDEETSLMVVFRLLGLGDIRAW
jgi:LPS-assembly protein